MNRLMCITLALIACSRGDSELQHYDLVLLDGVPVAEARYAECMRPLLAQWIELRPGGTWASSSTMGGRCGATDTLVSTNQGRVVPRGDTLQLVPGNQPATYYGGSLGFVRGDTLLLLPETGSHRGDVYIARGDQSRLRPNDR